MSIYKNLLGESYERLHPKLQERYSFQESSVFHAKGVMSEIKGAKRWMYPFMLLLTRWNFIFPESGRDIPFDLVNRVYERPDGIEEAKWERIFFFPKVKRRFHAQMTIDSQRNVVRDYLGEPTLFYSDLIFRVTNQGTLAITSASQKLVMGRIEIPLPKVLQGNVEVVEGYDDTKEAYTIHVKISNRLVGDLLSYKGTFRK